MPSPKTLYAYCYANGVIAFGSKIPDGALPLGYGKPKQVREWIMAVSRHAYRKGLYLVPGVPEAPNERKALKAYQAFIKWARPQLDHYARPVNERYAHKRAA